MTVVPRAIELVPPPRAVPLSLRLAVLNGFRFKAGTIILVAGMAAACYLGLPLAWRDARFWFAGPLASTRAAVTAVEPTRWTFTTSKMLDAANSQAVRRYRYRFVDAGGRSWNGTSYRETSNVLRSSTGEPQLDVEFAASHPSINRARDGRVTPVGWLFLPFLLVALVGGLLLRSALRASHHAIRLLAIGVVASARVVSRRVNSAQDDSKPGDPVHVVDVEVEFATAGGETVRVKRHVIDRADEIGDEPEELVLYDAASPEHAVLIDSLPGRPAAGADGRWQPSAMRPVFVVSAFLLLHGIYLLIALSVLMSER